jgi:hypothetical protein
MAQAAGSSKEVLVRLLEYLMASAREAIFGG